ncbi:MAG: hypothetical protein JJE21_08965 [Spirochaetaceae bacterium]|nr:hypothetical protein [Spirochaetaceae bacterium]
MKKKLILFLLFAFSIVPIFSQYNTSTIKVDLTVKKNPKPYTITLLYINNSNTFTDFTNDEQLTVNDLDLINGGETKHIRVLLSEGNEGEEHSFTTKFTANPFFMTINNVTYEAGTDIKVFSVNSNLEQYSFSKLLPIGRNEAQIIAEVIYKWGANPEIPSGSFISTNTLNVTSD